MDMLFPAIADFIARHHGAAGLVLGVVTALEGIVLLGAFIPATALMVMAGGLIAAGVLDGWAVLMFCVAGAVLGNVASFAIGRHLGPRALRHPALAPHRRAVARTRLFTRKNGAVAIFLGRFFGPVRAFIPLVAGLVGMNQTRFHVSNVVSAILWVPIMLAPGFFAAKGLAKLETLGEADSLTIALIVAASAAVGGFLVWRIVLPHLRARRLAAAVAAQLCPAE
jgi:membrane protein DedA with SNARE-associated domain